MTKTQEFAAANPPDPEVAFDIMSVTAAYQRRSGESDAELLNLALTWMCQMDIQASWIEMLREIERETERQAEPLPVKPPHLGLYYHVTPSSNAKSIEKYGLLPRTGPRSAALREPGNRVYLFDSYESMETALMNWLGDEFGDEPLTVYEVKLPEGLEVFVTENFECEFSSAVTIPFSCLTIKEQQ